MITWLILNFYSEVTNQTEMGELQFQHNKLQELHQQLQKQLAEMEEMNLSLSTDNSKLKLKINRYVVLVMDIGRS